MYPSLQLTPLDWQFQTEPSDKCCLNQKGRSKWPRGKVIGGSSVLNAMLYVRGNRRDYDQWKELGNEGNVLKILSIGVILRRLIIVSLTTGIFTESRSASING